jgi:hypothetical protein
MAADFAEQALPIWQAYAPNDNRPELAIKAARDYAHGRITRKELDAARDAAKAARDAGDAGDAWDAARDAAWAAEAARAAAWDATRAKQRKIFINYLQPEEVTE